MAGEESNENRDGKVGSQLHLRIVDGIRDTRSLNSWPDTCEALWPAPAATDGIVNAWTCTQTVEGKGPW